MNNLDEYTKHSPFRPVELAAELESVRRELNRRWREEEDGPSRQSGRTTRMMELARKLAKQGKAVYVVFHTYGMRDSMQRWHEREHGEVKGIRFETAQMLPELDWWTLTLRNAHPNCVVLVDHAAIEDHFRIPEAAYVMMHAFDREVVKK